MLNFENEVRLREELKLVAEEARQETRDSVERLRCERIHHEKDSEILRHSLDNKESILLKVI